MKQRIYVELDALLDTRLGTLMIINESEAKKALDSGYRDRKTDVWEELGLSIDQDNYNQVYNNRTIDTLKASRCSSVVPMINHLTNSLESSASKSPLIDEVIVEVNTWPYDLNDDEKENIVSAIKYMISTSTKVELINYSPEALTPVIIDQTWDGLIMYDFNRWLELHVERLKEKRITRVVFITPAVFSNGVPKEDDLNFEGMKNVNPFGALEIILTEFLTLQMVDVKYFSLVEL